MEKIAVTSTVTGTASLPEQIAEQIRDDIVRGRLAPGAHLLQVALEKKFRTSRGPVREALKLLAAEGVVAHDPNRGFFIAQISAREARQLYRLRSLIEGELLTTIQWPDRDQLAHLESLIVEIERALAAGDRAAWVRRHRAFHIALFQLSDAEVLVGECLRLWMLTDRYRSLLPGPNALGDARWAPTDERLILIALASRDRDTLVDIIETDRVRVEELILEVLDAR